MGIPIGHMFRMSAIPPGKNPFELDGPNVKGTLDIRMRVIKRVHIKTAPNAGELFVRVGGAMTASGPITWSAEVPLPDGEQIVTRSRWGDISACRSAAIRIERGV